MASDSSALLRLSIQQVSTQTHYVYDLAIYYSNEISSASQRCDRMA